MPEQPVASVLAQSRRTAWSMIAVLPLCGIAAAAWAQDVPAGLRACTAESDSARRLACYDREMARLATPPAPSPPRSAAPPPPAQTDVPSGSATSQAPQAAPQAPPPPEAPPPPPPAQPPQPPPAAAAPSQPSAPPVSDGTSLSHRASAAWKALAGGGPARVTAHVARLERSPDSTIFHLDNGQVWRQIGRATGDLSLRAGDSVTIEKHLGSYWLSSRYVSNMQVRLESRQSQ